MKTIKVRIVKSTGKSWYEKSIGDVFNVYEYNSEYYISTENVYWIILKTDCEVIPETLNIIELFDYLKEHPGSKGKYSSSDNKYVQLQTKSNGKPWLFWVDDTNEIYIPVMVSEEILDGWTVHDE